MWVVRSNYYLMNLQVQPCVQIFREECWLWKQLVWSQRFEQFTLLIFGDDIKRDLHVVVPASLLLALTMLPINSSEWQLEAKSPIKQSLWGHELIEAIGATILESVIPPKSELLLPILFKTNCSKEIFTWFYRKPFSVILSACKVSNSTLLFFLLHKNSLTCTMPPTSLSCILFSVAKMNTNYHNTKKLPHHF